MLRVEKISKHFGGLQALSEVSFEVTQGEIVGLIGPNGAGKPTTTTLKSVLGLLPPIEGQVTFRGESIVGKMPHEIVNEGMTLVPEWRGTFSTMTVQENLELGAFPLRARPYKDKTLKEVYEIFPRLAERKTQLAGTMSGGERQMLAIGRALMAKPELLILDEPSLGLAPLIVENTFEVIKRINQQGVSILIVEQNVHMTLETAYYGYIIETGQIVKEGLCSELMADPAVKEAYLSL